MPYQVSNDSIVQAIMRGRVAGQETMNVIHLRPVDAPVGDIADGLANLVEIAGALDITGLGWSKLLGDCCQEDTTFDWLQLQYVWPTRFSYYRQVPDAPGGVKIGDAAPPNVSAVITYQGDAVGRHERGNQHIFGLLASDVTEGRIDATLATSMNALADFLVEPFTVVGSGLEYEMVIYQRAAPGASVPVTHHTVQTTSRVTRRRTVGLGS